MDINHLTYDEFLVECRVRSLEGTHVTMFTQLLEILKGEADHPVLVPIRAHTAALKKPKREILLCSNKIQSLKQLIVENSRNPQKEILENCCSRLIHINVRLKRISSSPTYGVEAQHWLEAGIKLLALVDDICNNSENLDESLEEIENMNQWRETVETCDPYDFDDDSEEPSDPKLSAAVLTTPKHGNWELGRTLDPSLEPVAGTSTGSPADKLAVILSSPQGDKMLKLLDEFHQLAVTTLSTEKNPQISATKPLNKATNPRKIRISNPLNDNSNVRNATLSDAPVRPCGSKKGSQYSIPPPGPINPQFSNPPPKLSSSYLPGAHSQRIGYSYTNNGQNSAPVSNFSYPGPNQQEAVPDWNDGPYYTPYNSYFHPQSYLNRKPETWNLSFEGTKNDVTSIERFLTRVEKMSARNNVPPIKWVDLLGQLLKGDALEWYWLFIERYDTVTWSQIKAELISRFEVRKTDDDIHRELASRRQYYPRESFYDFYSSLLKLSMQLRVPLTEAETLRYLKCGMRPGLHLELGLQLNFIHSVESLVRNCVDLEGLWVKYGLVPEMNLRSIPSPRQINEISNDMEIASCTENHNLYHMENSSHEVEAFQNNYVSGYRPPVPKYADLSQNVRPSTAHQSSNQDVLCYNCRQMGHYANNCPQRKPESENPKPFLCQACGKAGNVMTESRPSAPPLQISNSSDNKNVPKKDPVLFSSRPRN